MKNKKSILAIIPARGGSKGVLRKNIREIAGKPLIAWTIEAAKRSKYIDRLILSSEDTEIMAVASKFGCEVPFVRPNILAQDDTSSMAVILHALEQCPGYDYILLLQPTSPLRTEGDIDACIDQCIGNNANACVSLTEAEKSPYWMYRLDEKSLIKPLLENNESYYRRQNAPKIYAINGALYFAARNLLLEKKSFISIATTAYIMPKERSLDIDSELDLKICELLLVNQAHSGKYEKEH